MFYFIDDIIPLMLKLVFNKIGTFVTSCTSFIYCISLNFTDISTVFEEIKHLRSRAPKNILTDY